MADDVIKNPARNLPQIQRESYTPEYIRLNMEPVIQKVNKNDFLIGKKNRAPLSAPAEESSMGPMPSQAFASLGKEEAVVTGKWFEEMKNDPNAPIEADSVKFPEDDQFDLVPSEVETSSSEENDIFELQDLEPKTYCVFVCGTLVSKSISKEEAELLIQRMLSEDTPPFKDINMDDIMLLKRLQFRVGVISEE